jgi:putative transposase
MPAKITKAHGFVGSMIRKCDCWDNAVAERFFGGLKQERVHWRNCQSRLEAQQDVLNDISMFYSSQRLHSYLGYMSPNHYQADTAEMRKAAQLGCKEMLGHVTTRRGEL